ncbi:MAG: MATE family efflux transporter, partial [Pseudomonadota bacterium]|nr:MATE family efflux transporter [Pseudomonadota bacterium]
MRPVIHSDAPWRAEFKATSRLAGPLVITQLAQFSLSLTDTILIGRLGGDALAAVGLASTLYIVAYLLCMGILAAVPPLAAQAYGARKPRLMRRTIRQGLWISVMLGILSIGALWPAEQIFLLLGQTPDLAAVSQEYVRAAVWGIVPGLCVIAMRGFISVMDRPNFILIVMLTGFTVNALADYAFIFGVWGFPKLGVMGVGLATTFTNFAMCTAIMIIAMKANRLRRYNVLGRFWRPDWSVFKDILKVGIPISAMIMMEHSLFASATFMMGNLGTAEVAAHTIALQLAATSFMVPLGIGQAAVIRVGLAVGRKDIEGVRRAGWLAIGLGFAFMFGP